MQDTANPRVVIGNNMPPLPTPIVTEALEQLQARLAGLLKTADDWKASPAIADQETADAAGGFKKQLVALKTDSKAALAIELEPYQTAIATIKARYADIEPTVVLCQEMIDGRLKVWLDAEQARMNREAREAAERAAAERAEAERLLETTDGNSLQAQAAANRQLREAEAAEREAAALQGQRAKVGGQFRAGGVARSVSSRVVFEYVVADFKKATAWLLKVKDARRELEALVVKHARYAHLADKKAERETKIPGVEVKSDTKPV